MTNRGMKTTEEVAAYLGLQPSTLHNWRVKGFGPIFYKLGRRVVYDLDDVDEWCAAQKRQTTQKKDLTV